MTSTSMQSVDYWSPERVRARRVERVLYWLLQDEPGQGMYRADRISALAEVIRQSCDLLRRFSNDLELARALRRLADRIDAGEGLSA